jgi:hypothetical protein
MTHAASDWSDRSDLIGIAEMREESGSPPVGNEHTGVHQRNMAPWQSEGAGTVVESGKRGATWIRDPDDLNIVGDLQVVGQSSGFQDLTATVRRYQVVGQSSGIQNLTDTVRGYQAVWQSSGFQNLAAIVRRYQAADHQSEWQVGVLKQVLQAGPVLPLGAAHPQNHRQ